MKKTDPVAENFYRLTKEYFCEEAGYYFLMRHCGRVAFFLMFRGICRFLDPLSLVEVCILDSLPGEVDKHSDVENTMWSPEYEED